MNNFLTEGKTKSNIKGDRSRLNKKTPIQPPPSPMIRNNKLPPYTQSCLLYAARYAHTRNTSASYQVVNSIMWHWDQLDDRIKEQLQREARSDAIYNMEDWDTLISRDA